MLVASNPWVDWTWVSDHKGPIWSAAAQHLQLTFLAVGIGLAISLPAALWVYRHPATQGPVYGVAGALFAIPSLALFAFLIPITGLDQTTAEIGLVSYTLLILIRNIVTGLQEVPAEVRDAATGLGYSRRAQLWRVELPLAMPAIISGIRIATVTTIGLVTIASVVGAGGGLGFLIQQGQQNGFRTQVVVGAGGSVILALLFDLALVGAGRLISPWTARRAGN